MAPMLWFLLKQKFAACGATRAHPRWIRVSMYVLLLSIGGSTVFQLILVHRAETLRSADSKLLRLAGSQGSLSQHISRFSLISQQERAEQELRKHLKVLEDQAAELGQLLDQEINAPSSRDYPYREQLESALGSWRIQQPLLVDDVTQLLALMEAGESVKRAAASTFVQMQADRSLSASENLAQQIQVLVNERSIVALANINHWIVINIVLMLILAAGVVEPTIVLVRRQYSKIENQASELETLASERERLASASWQEAQSAARKATEEKIMFLAIGSHDLRTPMQTVISTVVSMSRKCEASPLASQFAVDISKLRIACEHIVGIADDLGEFVRDAENYTTQAKKRVHLSELILNVYDLYYEEAVNNGLQLELIENHQTDQVFIEETLFRRVVSNLIANAIKYTPSGHVKVTTSSPEERLLRVTVSDTGIGIDPAQIAEIAKPFFRVKASRHMNKSGLGLGLSIVDKFVGHMAGAWSVSSVVDKGSTFTVDIPIGEPTPHFPALAVPPTHAPASAPSPGLPPRETETQTQTQTDTGREGTIVFVDDDTELLQGLCHLVDQRSGLTPVGFSNIGEALAYLDRHAVTCCFVDLQMLPVDGYEFAARLKERLGDRTPCLIAMSAYAIDQHQEHLFELYVSKPISLQKLTLAVQRIGALSETL
jgi:signal transduction histidine kinase